MVALSSESRFTRTVDILSMVGKLKTAFSNGVTGVEWKGMVKKSFYGIYH